MPTPCLQLRHYKADSSAVNEIVDIRCAEVLALVGGRQQHKFTHGGTDKLNSCK